MTESQALRPNDATKTPTDGTSAAIDANHYQSGVKQPGDRPTPSDTASSHLPSLTIDNSEEKKGNTTIKKDDQGSAKEYDNGNYSLAKHDDGKWYFHQNGDDHAFVEVDGNSIKTDDQGKVSYSESGLFGKENQTLGDGSTGFLSSITSAASHVEDAVINHPLDTFNTLAFAPLAAVDAVAGTHTIQAIGEIEKGAANEVIHHPGEILKDVAIGVGIGALTVATGGGALVALGIGAAALTATELVKNNGDLGGVVNDAKSFGNTVVDWGTDFATVAGPGQHSQEELAGAKQGLQEVGAFGAHLAAGAAGGAVGGFGAEALGLQGALPRAARAVVSKLSNGSDDVIGGTVPKGPAALRDDGSEYPEPVGRTFEPGLLEAKTAALKKDLGITKFTSNEVQREKLLTDLDTSPRIQITRNGDDVSIYNGNTRYALAKSLGIPDNEIPVWGGHNFSVKQFLRPENNEPITEPIALPRQPESQSFSNSTEPFENRGAFNLPNGESIDPHSISVMKSAGLSQDSYVYRVMDSQYLDMENGLVRPNPDSMASIYHPDAPPQLDMTLENGMHVRMPGTREAKLEGPGLNVATGNPAKAYGLTDNQVLIGLRVGDMLAKNGRIFNDAGASMGGAYYMTFDGAVPFYFINPE